MEISEIKSLLTLSQVLQHYQLQPKNHMLTCPWHKNGEEKHPSLQVNLEKNFYHCHACGRKGDPIQWVQDYENNRQGISKHQALLVCSQLADEIIPITKEKNNETTVFEKENKQTDFLEKMFPYFKKAVYNSVPAKEYLQQRNLNYTKIEVGFNSGQFHHGERKTENLINQALEIGLLLDKGLKGKDGQKAYGVFANKCLIFPLKNKENNIVSIYGRSIYDNTQAKHFYLKNRKGLYPHYPKPATKKLILTEAIIDCASLLQIKEITENYSILSCYGINGLTHEHVESIKSLKELEEIIFCFDNDKSGKEAVTKYGQQLITYKPKLIITKVELPENEDVNSLLQGHTEELLIELIKKRKEILFSSEEKVEELSVEELKKKTRKVEELAGVDLEEPVENIREKQANQPKTIPQNSEAFLFLKQKDLLQGFNNLIGKLGIVGEERNRLLMFLVALTYKMNYNLHVLYQGSSGSGKTHTIKQIALLIPEEDVIYLTRVTDSSLYNYQGGEFMYKLVIFEDMDGLKEDALLAVREMISNKKLASSTSIKDKRGNAKGAIKNVEVSFASLSATTKGELYEDNMSRIIVLSVDESQEQTQKIIRYKNQIHKGEIDKKEQQKIIYFIRACVRLLKPYEVVNPFADVIELPKNVHKPTRMHELVMGVINQIVILNQYQRKSDKQGRLLAEKEDLKQGLTLMKDSILLKMDELEGKIRKFYEELKKYTEQKAKKENKKRDEIKFTRFDIKDRFLLSKTQQNEYLRKLVGSEYLQQIGYGNKGRKYTILHWDNFKSLSEIQLDEMFRKIDEKQKRKNVLYKNKRKIQHPTLYTKGITAIFIFIQIHSQYISQSIIRK